MLTSPTACTAEHCSSEVESSPEGPKETNHSRRVDLPCPPPTLSGCSSGCSHASKLVDVGISRRNHRVQWGDTRLTLPEWRASKKTLARCFLFTGAVFSHMNSERGGKWGDWVKYAIIRRNICFLEFTFCDRVVLTSILPTHNSWQKCPLEFIPL